MRWHFKISIIITLICLFLGGCARRTNYYEATEILLGTEVQIQVRDFELPRSRLKNLVNAAFSLIRQIESDLSHYLSDSDISRINREADVRAVKVSQSTFEILKKAKYFSQLTGGAFDVTVLPLLELWGFGKNKKPRVPFPEEIETALNSVGMQFVVLDEAEKSVRLLKPNMWIDLSGIAKGFAVDKAAGFLKSSGISGGLINAGGDIYCWQEAPLPDWKLGIQHPRKKRKLIAIMNLKEGAIATSGDYENYFFVEGRRYSHIIDPRTGLPKENDLVSSTVLASDCTSADALSTALLVLGRQKGLGLIEGLKGFGAFVISENENNLNFFFSKGMEEKIVLFDNR
jgi:thiamine biosynthesis lipoprotein